MTQQTAPKRNLCRCELRDRQWNFYGKCLTCGCAYEGVILKWKPPLVTACPEPTLDDAGDALKFRERPDEHEME